MAELDLEMEKVMSLEGEGMCSGNMEDLGRGIDVKTRT